MAQLWSAALQAAVGSERRRALTGENCSDIQRSVKLSVRFFSVFHANPAVETELIADQLIDPLRRFANSVGFK